MMERGQYRFTVKENARGEFWLAAEPAGDTIKSLDDCVLGFHLEPKGFSASIDRRRASTRLTTFVGGAASRCSAGGRPACLRLSISTTVS